MRLLHDLLAALRDDGWHYHSAGPPRATEAVLLRLHALLTTCDHFHEALAAIAAQCDPPACDMARAALAAPRGEHG